MSNGTCGKCVPLTRNFSVFSFKYCNSDESASVASLLCRGFVDFLKDAALRWGLCNAATAVVSRIAAKEERKRISKSFLVQTNDCRDSPEGPFCLFIELLVALELSMDLAYELLSVVQGTSPRVEIP